MLRYFSTILPGVLALAMAAVTLSGCARLGKNRATGTIADTLPVEWTQLAHGVYAVELGDVSAETRYTELAGAPPRFEALNRLPDMPLTSALNSTRFRLHPDGMLSVRIPTAPGERIYGYGLQFDRSMHSGRILELKVDHFNQGGGKTHAPVPFFLSSAGYGVLFDTARYLKVHNQVGNRRDSDSNPPEVDRNPPPDEPQAGRWLAKPPSDAVEAHLRARGLWLIGFTGTDMLDIVCRYNLFSGGGALPPLWGLGFWHRTPSKYTASQVESEVGEFAEHRIPLDVIGLEPGWQTKSYPCTFEWQPKRFPDPDAFLEGLADDGIRVNLWINPYLSRHAPIYEAMRPLSGSHLVWLGLVPDYTLSRAREILVSHHRKRHIDLGVAGYKIDEVDGYDRWLWPDHATFPSGTPAEVMRQTYGLQMQDMLHAGLFEAVGRRTYSLVRASNGAASAYPFAIYSDSYGHAEYITGISSASLSGVLWCPEIRNARSEREWINRMHTVCFSALAQLNAWAAGTKPWSYPDATDAVRQTIQLRMQLLPYLYTAFARYYLEGVPPVRSLLLDRESVAHPVPTVDGSLNIDPTNAAPYADGFTAPLKEDNSVFLFGPDILVAPFVEDSVRREIRLPFGCDWFDFYTGRHLGAGGAKITIHASDTNDLPPLLVRDGALIPILANEIQRSREVKGSDIEIRVYGNRRDRSCQLYEDDAESFAYRTGVYRLRSFSISENDSITENTMHDGLSPDEDLYRKVTVRLMSKRE